MAVDYEALYQAVRQWCEAHGISVREQSLSRERAGEFDGISATLNGGYSVEERALYLAHTAGSIVRWCSDKQNVEEMFRDLHHATAGKGRDPAELEPAVLRYHAFEADTSRLAVQLLTELGFSEAIAAYTNFMRADLEAMTQFHRTGRAPVWNTFFSTWNERIAAGQICAAPFPPRPLPHFRPERIPLQRIQQQQERG